MDANDAGVQLPPVRVAVPVKDARGGVGLSVTEVTALEA
jgi:hypothetical protein